MGAIAHDETHHGNHGTLQGNPIWEASTLAINAETTNPPEPEAAIAPTDPSQPVAVPAISTALDYPTPPSVLVSPAVHKEGIETMAKTTAQSTAVASVSPTLTHDRQSVLTLGDSHQGIAAGSGALKPRGRFTIEAWIYPTTTTGKQVIYSEGESLFYVENGELKYENASAASPIASVGAVITPGNWYHVAVARGGRRPGKTKLFINGTENDNQATIPAVLSTGSTYLGSQPDVADSRFQGKLLEVRVWRFARSQADIQDNMTYFITGRELGLVRCWTGDEGHGTAIGDRTTNRAGGTVLGDATWEEVEIPIKTNLNAQERLTRSTGLEDYGYWYKEMAKQQTTEAEPYFRRGRIWA